MTVAYADAEWLAGVAADPPLLAVEPDGTIRFGQRSVTAPGQDDPDAAALVAFASLADAAVSLVDGAGSVEVTGNGIVAALVRAAVTAPRDDERPQAIVDTTGDPAVIADATRRLADRGVLVLAGESLGRSGDLDVYPDVHVRGLTVVGAGPLLSHPLAAGTPAGMPVPGPPSGQAPWYRIER